MCLHERNAALTDDNAARVAARVREGRLGLLALHSAHWAKPFVLLMQERAKADALAQVPEAERAAAKWEYLNGNPIGIDVKRDGPLTPAVAHDGGIWRVGMGGVFYFRPGHETYPVFQQAETLRVIENSVRWLASFE